MLAAPSLAHCGEQLPGGWTTALKGFIQDGLGPEGTLQ